MTLKELYRSSILELKKNGIPHPELDARVIIAKALEYSAADFYKNTDLVIPPKKINQINKLIAERAKNYPLAYLFFEKEFYGLNFFVNESVLIPRPESEGLIDKSIEFIKLKVRKVNKVDILDLGTGSGNIVISLAKTLATDQSTLHTNFYASDISKKALTVAKKNAKLHGVDKEIKFIYSDLFSNRLLNNKFDLIIANLPYVPKTKSPELVLGSIPNSISYEPKDAIFAEDNGAKIIKNFLKLAPNHIKDNGMILIELDPRNAGSIESFAKKCFPKTKIRLEKDLAGFLRYLIVE